MHGHMYIPDEIYDQEDSDNEEYNWIVWTYNMYLKKMWLIR